MTRKDFALIARVIAEQTIYNGAVDKRRLISDMADALATTNPAFKRERFEDACDMRLVIRALMRGKAV